MKRLVLIAVTFIAGCVPEPPFPPLSPTVSGQEARLLFGAETTGGTGLPQPIGGYAGGCVDGAVELPETGPTWQAMRLSRNRNWGHPAIVDYVQDLSAQVAAETSWVGLYVGDLSQPRGGPMLSGHRSHQSGLDADIWMLPARDLTLTEAERESISSISTRRADGAFVGENWTEEHWDILRMAASDPRVARIFVFPGAKVWMCENETGDRDYLSQIRPWWGHHYHFHVRLHCPVGAEDCVDQAPVPAGDGCDEALGWQERILNPPPPAPPDPNAPPPQPRRELTLADLPRQCAEVLTDLR